MSQIITFAAIFAVVLVGVIIAFLRIRNYSKKERLHQELSDKYGLRGRFINEKKFELRGKYREYYLSIESFLLPPNGLEDAKGNSLKFSLKMTNPLRKCLRILKTNPPNSDLEAIVPLDKLLTVKHDLGEYLQIHTNDLVFSSLILSENARISIHDAMSNIPGAAIMYIQDEELSCIVPGLLSRSDQLGKFHKIVDALADMKDELN